MNINDVAKYANVAKSTVSSVLSGKRYVSNETKKKVMKACEALNYKPNYFATKLINNDSNIIGLFFEEENEEYYLFYSDLLKGCIMEAYKNQKLVLPYFAPNGEEIRDSLGKGYSPLMGAVLLTPFMNDERIEILFDKHIPVVVIGETQAHNSDIMQINIDNEGLVTSFLEHLYNLGHKKILFINSQEKLTITQERDRAVDKFLHIYSDCKIIIRYAKDAEGVAIPIVDKLIDNFSAIIVSSDILALELYGFYQKKGQIIGKDISIIALGGEKSQNLFVPSLTRGAQNYALLGRESISMLLSLQTKKNQVKLIKSEIVYGNSVAKLK